MDSLTLMCSLSIINYSNVLRIKIKSVYVKDFLISTKVRLKRVEHLHVEEPISSEPTFNTSLQTLFQTTSKSLAQKSTQTSYHNYLPNHRPVNHPKHRPFPNHHKSNVAPNTTPKIA